MPGLIRFSKCKGFFDQIVKGHLISKLFFGVIDILQKTNERIRLYYTVIKILLLLDLIGYFYPLIGNMVDFKLQDLDN